MLKNNSRDAAKKMIMCLFFILLVLVLVFFVPSWIALLNEPYRISSHVKW